MNIKLKKKKIWLKNHRDEILSYTVDLTSFY